MRLRFLTLPLFLAATVSCQSTPAPSEPSGVEHPSTPPQAQPERPLPDAALDVAPLTDAAVPRPVQGQDLADEAERIARRKEARALLAKEFVEQGQSELQMADLQAALGSFANALQLDPQNEAARAGYQQTQAALGDEYGTAMENFEGESQRIAVKRAQALLEVQENVSLGDNALRVAEYDKAINHYRNAENILRWHPIIATDSLDEQIVRGKLENAIAQRDAAAEEALRVARAEAESLRKATEAEELQRRERKLQTYYERANQAFIGDDYSEAEQWCDLILVNDPGNEAALKLKGYARELKHARANEVGRKNYREQWQKTFDELGTMDVPQTGAIRYDLHRWREVSQRTPLSDYGDLDASGSNERQAVLNRLDAVSFAPPFDETPLESVAAYMQSYTGVNFYISPAVRDLDIDETTITLKLPERSVRKVLDLIAETRESLRWKIEDGVVKFVTVDELTGGQVLVNYSVHDLITPIPDYPGRDINISPSGGLTPPDEDTIDREANVVNSSLLEDLIRHNIAAESWDADPGNQIRITETGTMVVNQTPEVQEQIANLLDDLREATGIMVDIQARFMKVEDSFLEDIGVDFRGLGQPGLGADGKDFNDFGQESFEDDLNDNPGRDNSLGAFYDEGEDGDIRARLEHLYDDALGNDDFQGSGGLSFQWTFLNDLELELILRAVSKSQRVELVTAPRILVHNTARANLSVLNQVAYVQDFDVEIAQAASIADPIVAVIQDGVILDVRPVVSADRRFITLELRPTIAVLKRPIQERVTTLGSQNSVTIQLPEVEIQRVRTSIPIPDGGTVMLGGMKESEKKDQRSGVPILNKIPILSAFFERKGNFVSNRKLLILLRAHIVIPREIEPTPAEMGLTD
jgi:type II secretory pathway component GspD/PulD (secretin)